MDTSLYGYSIEDFREEAKELLSRAEGVISEIRETPHDIGRVNALFRVIHSLKGSAAYAGMADVTDFAHLYESFLGELRQKNSAADRDELNILIRARDYLDDLIFQPERVEAMRIDLAGGRPMDLLSAILKGRMEAGAALLSPPQEDPEPVFSPPPTPDSSETGSDVVRSTIPSTEPDMMEENDVIRITITSDLKVLYTTLKEDSPDMSVIAKYLTKLEDAVVWAFGDDSDRINKSILEMKGTISEDIGRDGLLRLRKGFNSLAAEVKKELDSLVGKVEEVKTEKKKEIEAKEELKSAVPPDEIRGATKDEIVKLSLTRHLDTLSDLTSEEPLDLFQIKRLLGRLNDLNRWAFSENEAVSSCLRGMEDAVRRPYDDASVREIRTRANAVIPLFTAMINNMGAGINGHGPEAGSPILQISKVETRQVLSLQEQQRPREAPFNERSDLRPATSGGTLRVKAEDVESLILTVAKLTGLEARDFEKLQTLALQLRMVQVGELFGRFRKVVRDLSEELNKEIAIEVSGESVKLDKVIADRLNEPIMHMIRNAAGHGIEGQEERKMAGKGPGLIRLNAYQEGGQIIIEISDNGRGISLEKVRQRGEAMGLIKSDNQRPVSEKAILDLIFMPGFSTMEQTDRVSGRGVGMDVVKEVVTSLQGSVSIDTREGLGTTFRIQLPLTLAIIKGMVLEHGGRKLALPATFVDRVINMTDEELKNGTIMDNNRPSLDLAGEGDVLPLVDLSTLFGLRGKSEKHCVVLVKAGMGQKAALLVDSAIGRQPLMVKPLDRFSENRHFSSAAILDNELVLILNTPSLMAA